jgi:hypothetical protein
MLHWPVRYGAWLDPQPGPVGVSTVTVSVHRLQALNTSDWSKSHLEDLWYHGVEIEIGTGPDSRLVRGVVDSIGFTKGAPNTPASGACTMSKGPDAMPTPERLSKPFVLDHGGEVLEPVLPSQHPVMPADSAWTESAAKEPFENYRLILARYFSKYPAQVGPGGSLTPLNSGELDWVVYSSPISASNSWVRRLGLDVYDALNGNAIGSVGWSPGP